MSWNPLDVFMSSMNAADEFLLMITVMIQEAFVRVNVLRRVFIQVFNRCLWRLTCIIHGCDFLSTRQASLLGPNPHRWTHTSDQETRSKSDDCDVDWLVGLIANLAGQAWLQIVIVVEDHEDVWSNRWDHKNRSKEQNSTHDLRQFVIFPRRSQIFQWSSWQDDEDCTNDEKNQRRNFSETKSRAHPGQLAFLDGSKKKRCDWRCQWNQPCKDMEQARLSFKCFRRPLLGSAQPPTQSKDKPPESRTYHEIIDDDEVCETLRIYRALKLTNVARLNWWNLVKLVKLVDFRDCRGLLIKYFQQIANAEQIITKRQEQDWSLGEFKASRFCPECDEWEEREDEAQNGKHQNARLDDFLLMGRVESVSSALINAVSLIIQREILRARREGRNLVVQIMWLR